MCRSQRFYALLLLLATLPSVSFTQLVPQNVSAVLLYDGAVRLQWDVPSNYIDEPFNEPLNGYDLVPGVAWTIDGGYLKGVVNNGWKSICSGEQTFTDLSIETTILNVSGGNSRGLIFRSDGPRDDDFNGYCFYISTSGQTFALYSYHGDDYELLEGWAPSTFINVEDGETNTLRVTAIGSQITLFINDSEVAQLVNEYFDSGYVGVVSSGFNEVWFEDLICWPEDQTIIDELDNIAEYNVYRDGVLVGTTPTPVLHDMLPEPGEYSYQVSALYAASGESERSNVVEVNYLPLILDMLPLNTIIESDGGDLIFDVLLRSLVGQTWPSVHFWTSITTPGGMVMVPLMTRTFSILPYLDREVLNLTQSIPGTAPAGTYTHTAHIFTDVLIQSSYQFEKLPYFSHPDTDDEGLALPVKRAVEGERSTVSSAQIRSWPNPFNELATVTLSLVEPSHIRVDLVNVTGRVVETLVEGNRSAGQHQLTVNGGSYATGVYFLRLYLDQSFATAQKIMLVK
jgi:3-keto-disaccharide hydrolase/Secretion system C-terminal sorting domain